MNVALNHDRSVSSRLTHVFSFHFCILSIHFRRLGTLSQMKTFTLNAFYEVLIVDCFCFVFCSYYWTCYIGVYVWKTVASCRTSISCSFLTFWHWTSTTIFKLLLLLLLPFATTTWNKFIFPWFEQIILLTYLCLFIFYYCLLLKPLDRTVDTALKEATARNPHFANR